MAQLQTAAGLRTCREAGNRSLWCGHTPRVTRPSVKRRGCAVFHTLRDWPRHAGMVRGKRADQGRGAPLAVANGTLGGVTGQTPSCPARRARLRLAVESPIDVESASRPILQRTPHVLAVAEGRVLTVSPRQLECAAPSAHTIAALSRALGSHYSRLVAEVAHEAVEAVRHCRAEAGLPRVRRRLLPRPVRLVQHRVGRYPRQVRRQFRN
jgi:hypothetical protein